MIPWDDNSDEDAEFYEDDDDDDDDDDYDLQIRQDVRGFAPG